MTKKIDLDSLKEKIIEKVEEIKGTDIWTSSLDFGPKSKKATFTFVYRDYHYVVDIRETGKDKKRKETKKQILARPKTDAIRIMALMFDPRFSKERKEI